MLQREFNYRALMVKEDNGGYHLASGDEIIEAALSEINRRLAPAPRTTKRRERRRAGSPHRPAAAMRYT